MNIRPKTVRRLTTLFLAMALVSGILVSWLMLSQRRLRAQIAKQRTDAIAAYTAKDYTTAVSLFREYLNRSHTQDTDAEAMFDYAKSRMNAATEGSRQVFEAIGVFERYLQLGAANDPRGVSRRLDEVNEANHLLLSLYVQAKYTKEATRVANNLLATNPKDAEALQNLVRALQIDGKAPAALDACRKLNAVIPPDLEWQMAELKLLGATGKPNDQVVARAKELATAHPNDSTFASLLSWADLVYGNDPNGAKQAIDIAVKLPPGKADTVLQIVRLLDAQQEFAQADDLLDRATAAQPNDPTLLKAVVERTWQRRSALEVLNRLEKPDAAIADSALLGYKALACFQSNQPDQATPLLSVLALRKDDISKAWSTALQTQFAPKPLASPEAVRKLTESTLRDPSNPVFWFFLGQQWSRMGEIDQAMRAWTTAAQQAPSWALPYVLISRSLCDAARYPEALRAAELARQRDPGTSPVETSYARAWFGLEISGTGSGSASGEANTLLALLETIQKTWKNEPSTLVQYVSMLARHGDREKAAGVIKEAIAAEPAPPGDVLVQLSAVSHDVKLGLEEQLLDRAEKAHGLSPAVAVARAMPLVESGKPADALAAFEASASKHPQDLEWRLADARLHDAVSSADAARDWSDLGEKFPDNVQVQYAILQSPTHLKDRDLWRQTIDRLKSLTGTDALRWQLEDAQWRLAGQPNDAEVSAIVVALQKIATVARSMPEVHRLLSEAILRSDPGSGVTRAIGELSIAHDLRPGDFETTSKLSQLLLAQGMRDRAASLVDAVASEPDLSPTRRLWAAAMYADLGKGDRAIAMLNAGSDTSPQQPAKDALLAQLYRRAGRTNDAATQYQKVLSNPSSTVESLAAGAEFYANLKQPDAAEPFLARIEKMSPGTAGANLLRAHVFQLAGQTDKAVATLQAATKTHPRYEQIWQELSGLYLRTGNLDDADRAAAEGVTATGGSSKLTAMRTQIARVKVLTPQSIAPLIEVISNDPTQPVADKAMTLLADAKARNTAPEQVLTSLRNLADQNSSFLPLQKLLAEDYVAAGRLKEACDIAARASASAPDDVDAIRLLCALQSASGNWEQARQTALRWKQLSPTDTLDADLAIALGYLRQSKPDPAGAAAQLAPYAAENSPEPKRTAALPIYCNALVGAGKPDEARTLLEPLLPTSAKWQSVWLDLASSQKDAASAVTWINRYSQLVKTDATDQKISLAGAWEQVGDRFDSADAYRQARTLLEPMVNAPGTPVKVWPVWAGINQVVENLPEAERAWREYLKSAPASPLGQNNLAYVLMLQGRPAQLTEADALAHSAIAKEPGMSTLYDTLARIQLRAGKTDDATKTFRAALDRNASNVDAMIGLAEILQARPQDREEARALLSRIDAAVRDGTPVASTVRKQLERVKSALSSSSL
jgi:predicted Zn-dependent protease